MSEEEKSVTIVDKFKDMETGDILLMGTKNFWFSRIVEKFTNSKWSHVGIILKDPVWINPMLTGYYLWQSGSEKYPDVEDDKNIFGVRIDKLEEKIETYDGYISWRHLKLKEKIPDLEEKLKKIHKIVHDEKYDTNIIDLLEATEFIKEINYSSIFNLFKHQRKDRFFCSALVGFIYQQLGLLPENTEWTRCEPKTFSIENTKLKLEMEGELSEEYVIKS
jgi:hypothetical protein